MKLRDLWMAAVAALLFAADSPDAQAFTIDRQFEGQWYEAGLGARRGWNLQYIETGPESGILFVVGFVYDAEGNPFWVNGAGEVQPGQFEVTVPLELVEGGTFGPDVGSPAVTDSDWGTMVITFQDCNNADFTWTSPNVGNGSNDFQPILQLVNGSPNSRCVYQQPFDSCPAFSTPAAFERTCILSGTYTQDITLTNDTIWVLSGGVFIGEPDATDNDNSITIEAGTRIIGTGELDLLVISRGAKIYAVGQPYAPIVFSGPNAASDGATAGSWGGLVINGFAPLNTCTTPPCTAVGEGNSGTYGGDDPNDSSGILRYVRVQFAGFRFTEEDELNGIALQGVGDGTVFEYIQVHRNADDGIEFYGGTVNARYLVLTDIEDDSLDWTQGYSGNIQFAIVKQIQNPEVDTDRGMEMDNLGSNNDAMPRAQPRVANITLLGKAGELGMNPRAGTGGNFTNMIVTGFSNCLDPDNAATFAAAGTPDNISGVLTFENMIFNCNTNFVENDEDNPDPWSVATFVTNQSNNQTVNPNLDGVYPPEGAAYLTGATMDPEKFGEFFDKVDFIGALRGRNAAWHYNWTIEVD